MYSHLRSCVPHAQAAMGEVMSQIGKPRADSTTAVATSAAVKLNSLSAGEEHEDENINISSAPSTAQDSICSMSWGILRHHQLCYCCYKNLSQ